MTFYSLPPDTSGFATQLYITSPNYARVQREAASWQFQDMMAMSGSAQDFNQTLWGFPVTVSNNIPHPMLVVMSRPHELQVASQLVEQHLTRPEVLHSVQQHLFRMLAAEIEKAAFRRLNMTSLNAEAFIAGKWTNLATKRKAKVRSVILEIDNE